MVRPAKEKILKSDFYLETVSLGAKEAHELVLDEADESEIFPVSGYTLGYVRDLSHGKGIDVGLGTQFTITTAPTASIVITATISATPSNFSCASGLPSTVTARTTTRSTSPECKNKRTF